MLLDPGEIAQLSKHHRLDAARVWVFESSRQAFCGSLAQRTRFVRG
jgi:hypothetical protein